MSATQLFKDLAFRVLLNPAPRTQSESNAIFQVLRGYGPIHVFQIHHHLPANRLGAHQATALTGASASLVFTHNTKSVYELRSDKSGRRFTVVANANIPDPSVKDPYNVRGLQSRKPELEPREIECRIIPTEEADDGRRHSVPNKIKTNQYSDGFAVDRNSIFAEILARTDCPSGLIHGLLPKLNDEHRSAAFDQGLMKTDTTETEPSTQAQRGVYFAKLDLTATSHAQAAKAATAESQDMAVDESPKDKVMFYDEFADLKDVSLMQMYRDATRAHGTQTSGTVTTFTPFRSKPRIK